MDNRTRIIAIALLIGGALILPAPGMAITFGFDTLVAGSFSYDEEGFRITANPSYNGMYVGSSGTPAPSMFPSGSTDTQTLVQISGAPFDATQIDICEINGSVGPQTVTFTGYLAVGGTVSQTFTTDGPYGFQTFTFNAGFRTLTQLKFNPGGASIVPVYDSIVVASSPMCTQGMSLTAGQWELISLPCAPGNTVSVLFGDDGLGTYGVDWAVVERVEATDLYRQLLLTDPMILGSGYWIKVLSGAPTIVEVAYPTPIGADFPIPLTTAAAPGRWNLVGHPFTVSVPWASYKVYDTVTATEYLLSDVNSGNLITNRTAYTWNGSSYQSLHPVANPGSLTLFDGFWVQAQGNTSVLRVPPSGMMETLPETLLEPGDWYVQLTVSSGPYTDPGNRFGQLRVATDGQDELDLQELEPYAEPYLTLVFPHPEWGGDAWSYTTDYRELRPGSPATWSFEVRSDQPRVVTLTWQLGGDARGILGRSTLVDLETGVRITPQPGLSYTFSMAGPTHRFAWRLYSRPTTADTSAP